MVKDCSVYRSSARISKMALLLLIAWAVTVIGTDSGQCNISASDWETIYTAFAQRDFYTALNATGACNLKLSNSLVSKYAGCSSTFQEALSANGLQPDCTSFMEATIFSGAGQTESNIVSRVAQICTSNSVSFVLESLLCNPLNYDLGVWGCPGQLDIVKFSVFVTCNGQAVKNLTLAAAENYYANGGDISCMLANDVCTGFTTPSTEGENTNTGSWATCPLKVQTVIDFIDQSNTYTCATVFTDVEYRCAETFEAAFQYYCPPVNPLATIYIIIICSTAGPCVIFVVIPLLWYFRKMRRYHISGNEILEQAGAIDANGKSSKFMYHPELAAIVASKYKGVSFNPQTGEWLVMGNNQRFSNEQEAARFAYLNLAGIGSKTAVASHASLNSKSSPPVKSVEYPISAYNSEEPEYVVTSVPLSPEEMKQRRVQQLISFYEYWEPTRKDIPEHAENLLTRHDFEHVARAVKTKYGVLPPGWAEELEV